MNSRLDLAPVAVVLMFAAIFASSAGGLHHVQTLRDQWGRAQCAGSIKQISLSLSGFALSMRDSHELEAPPLIESCLAEMEADDA